MDERKTSLRVFFSFSLTSYTRCFAFKLLKFLFTYTNNGGWISTWRLFFNTHTNGKSRFWISRSRSFRCFTWGLFLKRTKVSCCVLCLYCLSQRIWEKAQRRVIWRAWIGITSGTKIWAWRIFSFLSCTKLFFFWNSCLGHFNSFLSENIPLNHCARFLMMGFCSQGEISSAWRF